MRMAFTIRTETEIEGELGSGLLRPIGSPQLFQCHSSRVGLAPSAHCIQQRSQRLSERSRRVDNARRRIRVNGTLNDSRALELAELQRERSLRDSANSTLQFGESLVALEKLLEDSGSPTATDDTRRGFYRAEFWLCSHNGPSCKLYTTYQKMSRTPM